MASWNYKNTTDFIESSDYGRDGPDLLRGCLLPLATTLFLVVLGLLTAAGIGVVITIMCNILG